MIKKRFTFDYDLEGVWDIQNYIVQHWVEGKDYKMHFAQPGTRRVYGINHDIMNALDIYNSAVLSDDVFRDLINNQDDQNKTSRLTKESIMTQEEQNTITNFIGKIANKDYSDAQQALQNAVEAKLKTKIRSYIEQEK